MSLAVVTLDDGANERGSVEERLVSIEPETSTCRWMAARRRTAALAYARTLHMDAMVLTLSSLQAEACRLL